MNRKGLVVGTVSILIVVFVYWGTSSGAKDCGGIPAEKVADMVTYTSIFLLKNIRFSKEKAMTYLLQYPFLFLKPL